MIWFLLLGAFVVILWYILIKPLSYWKNLGVNQTKPWLFVGDSWFAFGKMSLAEFVEWIYNMHPNSRYSGFYHLTKPSLMIRDPELIKQITIKDFEHFMDRTCLVDPEADPFFGRVLAILQGQKWRQMRATLSGTFTSSKMKIIFHVMEEASKNFVQYFIDKNEDVYEIEMKDVYSRFTNDVIASAAFGIKCNSLEQPNNEFYQMGKEVTNISSPLVLLKFAGYFLIPKICRLFGITLFRKKVIDFFTNIITETIQIREEKGIVRPDLIHLLIEAKKEIKHEENEATETGFATVKESTYIGKFKQPKNITNEDIISQSVQFFFAGFDTVSTGMCFGSYELALNPDIQNKLREEIKETYKKTNGKVTYDVLLKMEYMDMVISEILRKWAPAPTADRVVTKPYTIEPVTPDEKPLHLNVGDVVFVPIHGLHRDPAYFPNPDKFDPERFSDENKNSINPYTYIPFGSGPRNCIGSRFALLELKSLFFYLLLSFEITTSKKMQIPLKFKKTPQNTAEGGFWFNLKRIKM